MVEADPSRDRYQLLETLRQYAWERLVATGRLGPARDAHATHFTALAGEQAKLMGVSGRQVGALDRLEVDYDNLLAALAHLVADRHPPRDRVAFLLGLPGLAIEFDESAVSVNPVCGLEVDCSRGDVILFGSRRVAGGELEACGAQLVERGELHHGAQLCSPSEGRPAIMQSV